MVKETSVHLSVFREHYEVQSIGELWSHLSFRFEGKYGAFWLTPTKNGFPAMGLFINGEDACMFYFRKEGDSGFHSQGVNPENFQDEVDFVIDNYQLDCYPLAMVIPDSQGVSAFEQFLYSRALPSIVNWFEV
jgi:hypothetical protein